MSDGFTFLGKFYLELFTNGFDDVIGANIPRQLYIVLERSISVINDDGERKEFVLEFFLCVFHYVNILVDLEGKINTFFFHVTLAMIVNLPGIVIITTHLLPNLIVDDALPVMISFDSVANLCDHPFGKNRSVLCCIASFHYVNILLFFMGKINDNFLCANERLLQAVYREIC